MSDSDLFKDVRAINAAGGINSFVTEVYAEVKRRATERCIRQNIPRTFEAVEAIVFQEIADVLLRRLRPDIERIWNEHIDAALNQLDRSADERTVMAAAEHATDVAARRTSRLVKAATDAVRARHFA